jgi:hypothetical protein
MGAATVEIGSGHVPLVSSPEDVAVLVKTAAGAAPAA